MIHCHRGHWGSRSLRPVTFSGKVAAAATAAVTGVLAQVTVGLAGSTGTG